MIAGRLRNLPVTAKLKAISMLTCCVGMVATAATLVVFDQFEGRSALVRDLASTAQMTGFNCGAALTFDDAKSAEQVLQSLEAQPHVVAACIFRQSGDIFATYRRNSAPSSSWPVRPGTGSVFSRSALELFQPIIVDGEQIGTLYVRSDLDDLGARLIRDGGVAIAVILVAALIAYLVASSLQRLVSRPVSHLAGVVARVAGEGNYGLRAVKTADDELGRLIDGFNDMLGQLQERDAALLAARDNLERRVAERTQQLEQESAERERLNRQLIEASRQAGMAEVAIGVLHNVGNVLNSVNVSATLAINQVRRSKGINLGRVCGMLREHADDLGTFLSDDPKGRKIPVFLESLATDLEAERGGIATELEQLRSNIEHIKQIVTMQQSYAKVYGVTESVSVAELVEDALKLNAGALARHAVSVVRDYGEPCEITVERHKVLQILVNLIRNAKYACDESLASSREMTVRIRRSNGNVAIAVADNGIGIPAENLTRIFNHGFTTRKAGHGFGLHSGAIVAKELGGLIRAESDGPGKGATFTLELPPTPPKP